MADDTGEGTGTAVAHPSMELRIAVLAELSAAMRGQSQAEYVYAAAALGGFSAVFLGVAALPSGSGGPFIRPFAAGFIVVVAILIIAAIWYNHTVYKAIRSERKRVADAIDTLPGIVGIVPAQWKQESSAPGVWRSILIVAAAGAGAAGCCLLL